MIIICIINCHSIGRKCAWMACNKTLNNTLNSRYVQLSEQARNCLLNCFDLLNSYLIACNENGNSRNTILNKYHRTGPSWYCNACALLYTLLRVHVQSTNQSSLKFGWFYITVFLMFSPRVHVFTKCALRKLADCVIYPLLVTSWTCLRFYFMVLNGNS